MKLYVKFHEEADKNPELVDEARAWFNKMENGDEEALSIWQWFKDLTLKDANRVYDMLGVKFDSYAGEAFYMDKMGPVLEELREKKLLKESDGAYSRATVEYSVDGWYITIPANFEGYVIIPVERLTSMPDDEEATSGAGDFISFHENDGYRYFWGIGMGVENHSNTNHATIEWINMFTIADTLDTGITGEVDEPTAAPDNTVALKDPSDRMVVQFIEEALK